MAPRIPETRVPCQLLLAIWQPVNCAFFRSLAEIQSPGSEASGPRPTPLLAIAALEIRL